MAADKEASLLIRLKDEATSGLSKLKVALASVATAFAGVSAFALDSFKAFLESETAANKLSVALKNQGIYSDALKTSMLGYSAELQKVTTFSDEAVTETQTLLTTFGLAGDELKRTTKAALDLSTGLGIDLRTATLLLGKAAVGETGSLSRFGIKIEDTIPPSERLNAVLTQLNSRFGGASEAQLNTFTGRMENLKNRVGELQEKIGAELLPVFESWAGLIEKIVAGLERITGASNNNLSVQELGIQKLKEERSEREALLYAHQYSIQVLAPQEVTYNQQRIEMIDRQIAALQAELTATQTKDNAIVASAQNTKTRLDALQKLKAAEDKKQREENLKEISKYNSVEYDAHVKSYEAYKKIQADRAAVLLNTLNYISTLSSSKNKELAAIGKAAAISSATVDAYAAANASYKALAGIPVVGPGLGAAAAALAITAGLANVSRIAGVQLAQGGIVFPRAGGIQATIGEGGGREAVIPLDDPEARENLQGIGGVTININAGTLIADQYSVDEFAKKIDVALFGLRRNNLSVALDRI